jgi:hypothetical protein
MSSINLSAAIVCREPFSQSLLDGMHRLGHDRHNATIARDRGIRRTATLSPYRW